MLKKRLFIAIDFPKDILLEINKIVLPEFKGKRTDLSNLHLTLKFLGEVKEQDIPKIQKILREIQFKKFKAIIDEVGIFSKENIRIIWINFKGAEDLQKKIDEKLAEFFSKEKRFMGHVTIARVKQVKNKKIFLEKIQSTNIKKMEFEVTSFYLKESALSSQGPQYKDVEIFELK